MSTESEIDWPALHAALSAPFNPADVDFRAGDRITEKGTVQRFGRDCPLGEGQALAYVDARVIMDRLDTVVGCQHWTFIPTALSFDAKQGVATALGALTIHGVTKYDFADASNFEGTKGCASDSLKRSAVHWGPGRYLYDLPRYKAQYVAYSKNNKTGEWNWTLEDSEKDRLRGLLPRPEEPATAPQVTAAAPPPRPVAPVAVPAALTLVPLRPAPDAATADPPGHAGAAAPRLAADTQKAAIRKLFAALKWDEPTQTAYLDGTGLDALTADQASAHIKYLNGQVTAARTGARA